MFSLHGTMKSLPAGGGPGGAAAAFGPRSRPAEVDRPVDVDHGRQLYAEACIACHGEAGDGGHGGGPTLVAGLPAETIQAVASAGRNTMPAFGAVYTPADIRDVARYIVDVLAAKPR
jgi:mono/diheme cytochrome c family protein